MELIPLPSEKKYLEMGQIRQKMGRILSYLIQKYSADCGKSYDDYSGAHRINLFDEGSPPKGSKGVQRYLTPLRAVFGE